MSEPLKGQVLRLEAAIGAPSADRSLAMLADAGLLTVFAGESWRSFTWEQWDALHSAGTRLLAGDQGRKAAGLAARAGGMALFPLAADVEEALEEATSLDDMTDARWARVLRALRYADECEADDAYPALRAFWDAAGKALAAAQTRTVTIPGSDQHNGMHSIRVTLSWACPQCGGPRGEPFKGTSYDGSRQLACDRWVNPCGHVDLYPAVRQEAAARDRQQAELKARASREGDVAECGYCTTRITLLGGHWTDDDGTTACTDTSAAYVPHKPAARDDG